MKAKRIFTLLLAMAMLAMLATACGGGTSTSQAADGSTAADSSAPADNAPTGDVVELEFFSQKYEVVDVMNEIIAGFEAENPGIKITLTNVPEARTVLQTRISSNDMPDILNIYPAETMYKIMFADGLLMDLTGQPFLENVQQSMLDSATVDGKIFSLPVALSCYGLYYNVDMFTENGIEPPTTYEEFLAVCEAFEAKGIVPLAHGFKNNTTQLVERLTGVINNDSDSEFRKIGAGELAPEDSPTLKTMADFFYTFGSYTEPDALGTDDNDAWANFSNGKTAMTVTGTWGLSIFLENNPDFNVELIPFPTPTPGYKTKVPTNIDTAYGIAESCPHKEEALKFLEYLSRTEIGQMYCDVDGSPNMIKGVQYEIAQHRTMSDVLAAGGAFITANNFWPSGLRDDFALPAQQLMMDGDKDLFIKTCGEIITQHYNK